MISIRKNQQSWAVDFFDRETGEVLERVPCKSERAGYHLIEVHQSTQAYRIHANAGTVHYSMIVRKVEP